MRPGRVGVGRGRQARGRPGAQGVRRRDGRGGDGDPSLAGSYPEWDEGIVGTEEATSDEGAGYKEQSKVDALFDSWVE
uniref:Uncharacterized protein n=1 Tax=Phyllostachys edulis TaxID=38705 RepID=D3IVF1_PHYED|nr:hypothetical protein [Phyllostachys edulis]